MKRLWCFIVGHLWWTLKEYDDAKGVYEVLQCQRCLSKTWLLSRVHGQVSVIFGRRYKIPNAPVIPPPPTPTPGQVPMSDYVTRRW